MEKVKSFSTHEAKAMAERVSPLPVSVSGGPADSEKTGHSKSKLYSGIGTCEGCENQAQLQKRERGQWLCSKCRKWIQ